MTQHSHVTTVGRDRYDRDWRLASSGVEHIVKPRQSWSGSPFLSLSAARDEVLSYCGRLVTGLPASAGTGEDHPCANCLRAEFADED